MPHRVFTQFFSFFIDCMGENMICVDDMDTCKNMLSPCCQMDPDAPIDEAPEARR